MAGQHARPLRQHLERRPGSAPARGLHQRRAAGGVHGRGLEEPARLGRSLRFRTGKTLGRFGSDDHLADEKHFLRVVSLAEIFFNLQAAPGVREKARELRGEDIESALGELGGAQLLYASGRPLEFVVPNGVRGESYDVNTALSDGTPVACEIKTKFESTRFDPKTVRRTLEQACRQLPTGRPGVVVMKVPEPWFDQVDAEEALGEAVRAIFRQRSTASAVFFHWHLWTKRGRGVRQNLEVAKHVNVAARHTTHTRSWKTSSALH